MGNSILPELSLESYENYEHGARILMATESDLCTDVIL